MSSFNLVQIVPSLESGGVERGTVDLSNFLSKKEISNHIISNGGNLVSKLNKEYTTHHKLPVNSKNFVYYPIIAKKISNYIKQNKINIIHVRSRAPAWITYFLPQTNFKTVSTFHNVYSGKTFLKKFYNKRMANMNFIIAISEYVKNEISKKYKIDINKIHVINRGIDTDFFKDNITDNEKKIFKTKHNIYNDQKIILYPGRITDWKGQYKFLSIVEKLNTKKFVVLFAGDTSNISHTSFLKKKIKEKNLIDKCKILGKLNDYELKVAYSLSDIVLSLPKRAEGFGRTISETLSMKKIILAKNIGGAFDQLKYQDNLHKINDKDFDQLNDKIMNILFLPEEIKKNIGIAGRQHVINNFSLNSMVTNYFNFYEKISV